MSIDPQILKTDERVACALRSLYHRFGYCQYKMSKFEEYALYVRNKDFLVSDGIISFTDTNGRLLALKPDVTLSIINNSKDVAGQTQKLYYDENVYRISRSSRSYKEIKQTGLECIGDVGRFEICEVLWLAVQSLKSIAEDYVFTLSHIGLLEAVLEELALTPAVRKKVIGSITRKSADELRQISTEASLNEAVQQTLSVFLGNFASPAEAIAALSGACTGKASAAAFSEFRELLEFLTDSGCDEKVKVDFSLVNDMNYYSGVAFRGYIAGIPTGVLSGGQYDKLMKKMGRTSGAVGFAVYLDTLERLNRTDKPFDVDIVLLHGGQIAAALKAAQTLSSDGTSVRVCGEVPAGIRYRQLLRLAGEEGEKRDGVD